MQNKLNFLLDRSLNFDVQHAEMLDSLTQDLKSNSASVQHPYPEQRGQRDLEHPQVGSLFLVQRAEGARTVQAGRDQGLYSSAAGGCGQGMRLLMQQKWLALPEDQELSLKNYIVDLILQYSSVEQLTKSMHNILSKCNSVLVQIVKYEWNSSWRSFINDICESSTKNMSICENNFYILKMLS